MKKMILILGLATLLLSGCTVVGPGERGVRFSFGKAQQEVMTPGTHIWFPYFAGSQTFDVKVEPVATKTVAGSKDQQNIYANITANVQIDPTKVLTVLEQSGTKEGMLSQVVPIISESVTSVVAKYSAEEILTKRQQLKQDVEILASSRLAEYGALVKDVSLDMDYSNEYAKAVELKQVAEQKAKQAQYETIQAREEKNATIAKAEGVAEANKLMRQQITPELIQYEAATRWNGQLPQVMSGSNMPFILNTGK